MKSLSQAEYGEIRDLYQSIYAPEQVDEEIEISDEELTEIIEETVIELLEEGYTAEEIEESFDDEFVDEILIEAKVTYGSDTESPEEGRARRRPGAKARLVKGDQKARDKKIADTKAAIKSAPGKALRAAARGTERAEKRAGEIGTKAVKKSKAGLTRAAMAATGVSGDDVPKKDGTKRSPGTFSGQRPYDRGAARKVMGKKIKTKLGSLRSKVKGAVDSVKMKPGDPDKSIKSRIGKARSGLKRMIGKAARRVSGGADRVAKRMGEEFETYDVVVEFLCDQGIAEDLQEAQWMMVNEVDSEDIATILEAYGMKAAKKSKKKK